MRFGNILAAYVRMECIKDTAGDIFNDGSLAFRYEVFEAASLI